MTVEDRVAKVLVPAILFGGISLLVVSGCGEEQRCDDVSGQWYLNVLEQGQDGTMEFYQDYSQDECTVEQKGCEISVDCKDGTLSYGTVDDGVATFPLAWLDSSDKPVYARCKVARDGQVTFKGMDQAAGLGCFVGQGALEKFVPVFLTVNCLEVAKADNGSGPAQWSRMSAPEGKDDECTFSDSFAATLSVEQYACSLKVQADNGLAPNEDAYMSGKSVTLDWPEFKGSDVGQNIKSVLMKKAEVIGPKSDGSQYLRISLGYWTVEKPAVENSCALYYELTKAY